MLKLTRNNLPTGFRHNGSSGDFLMRRLFSSQGSKIRALLVLYFEYEITSFAKKVEVECFPCIWKNGNEIL